MDVDIQCASEHLVHRAVNGRYQHMARQCGGRRGEVFLAWTVMVGLVGGLDWLPADSDNALMPRECCVRIAALTDVIHTSKCAPRLNGSLS